MRKIITILLVTLFSSISLLAQKKKMPAHFGAKTGINFSSMRLQGTGTNLSEAEWKSGFVIGAFVNIPLTKRFTLQPEFMYSSMGATITSPGSGTATYRFNYFSIPVLGEYMITDKWSAIVGPQGDFLLQAQRKVDDNQPSKITNDYKDHDVSVTAGIQFNPWKCLHANLRYIHGLTDIDPRPNYTLRNYGIQASVGVSF